MSIVIVHVQRKKRAKQDGGLSGRGANRKWMILKLSSLPQCVYCPVPHLPSPHPVAADSPAPP